METTYYDLMETRHLASVTRCNFPCNLCCNACDMNVSSTSATALSQRFGFPTLLHKVELGSSYAVITVTEIVASCNPKLHRVSNMSAVTCNGFLFSMLRDKLQEKLHRVAPTLVLNFKDLECRRI